MPPAVLYVIDYEIHGVPKSFIIRADIMNNAEAWHWASCDAGVARIPKFAREKIRRVSRPLAERFGVIDVRWRASGAEPFKPANHIPPGQ